EPHNDNDNPEDVMHQTNIENLDVHVSNRPQRYLDKSKQMDDAKYEKKPNWSEIQISLANAANKKDLEKSTKA
ncbi:3952_t:CDS:2, partial [Acaulospora morrowiae]